MIINIVGRTGPVEPDVFDDRRGHTIRRQLGKDSEAFEERAISWAKTEYQPEIGDAMIILTATNSEAEASARNEA